MIIKSSSVISYMKVDEFPQHHVLIFPMALALALTMAMALLCDESFLLLNSPKQGIILEEGEEEGEVEEEIEEEE